MKKDEEHTIRERSEGSLVSHLPLPARDATVDHDIALSYRSLGVHISFVRSIAMDSWTDQQLAIMKTGGNDKLHEFLKAKGGIQPRTPIKQKYESEAAQLYKLVLKARVEGKPEPTQLPAQTNQKQSQYAASRSAPSSFGAGGGPGPASGGGDPNGMERLAGETDDQYVQRQTRIRDEARARMAAKFGSTNGMMGGVGSGSSGGMAGIGSDPSYNPATGYGGGAGSGGIDSLVSGLGSAFGAVTMSVSSLMQDEQVRSFKQAGGSLWGSLASSVSQAAASITQPTDSGQDGLAQLQREIAQQRPTNSLYQGFGSDTYSSNAAASNSFGGSSPSSGGRLVQEAPGLPGEDRNGVERLTGESDDQYVMRQTRLREEARARMAAKFGTGGGLGGVGSSSAVPNPNPSPSSGNYGHYASSSSHPGGIRSAPTSGNAPTSGIVPNLQGPPPAWAVSGGGGAVAPSTTPRNTTPPKKPINSTDFFSSFGA